MNITLIADNVNSWIIPYVNQLNKLLEKEGHKSKIVHEHKEIEKGDLAFFLGCEKIVSREILLLNNKNLVVHESDLPKGRGWSPLTWQILEGKKDITITLFEADDKIDSGDIYLQEKIKLKGHELLNEIKDLQGKSTINLVMEFVKKYPDIYGKKQEGEVTYYPKRSPKDSQLNVDKSIREQFNLLRVVDNERYPAYFVIDSVKYILKIEKES